MGLLPLRSLFISNTGLSSNINFTLQQYANDYKKHS